MSKGLQLSIVSIAYDNSRGLQATLNSLLIWKQTTKFSFEHLVIDSSPAIHEKIRAEFENGNTVFTDSPREGIYAALNLGTQKARGEYVFNLNAGDIIVSTEAFEASVKNILDSTVDIQFSPVQIMRNEKPFRTIVPNQNFRTNLLGMTRICHQTVFIRRRLFKELGPYRLDCGISADYDFWILAEQRKVPAQFFNRTFAGYDADGVSSRFPWKVLREQAQIFYRSSIFSFWNRVCGLSIQIQFFILVVILKPILIRCGLFPKGAKK